ncbi:glycoside hydrolase family 10 protein [Thalassoglobus polymorphus]|uniref:Glycosyl hydrolase-like 10 domain-containing protein n=1 Tax=Thalassoglobus polymorphus TaxID=2527994 RepID=A0A517QMP5_9PLAN|nr:alpha-galactosidase [Thalassoglobus polymorphus]QDT32916.1 hypothetical protein Mal48_21640 [Thalassoglobus polymorphus]
MLPLSLKQSVTFSIVLLMTVNTFGETKPKNIDELRLARSQAAGQKRRLIFNNDGNEPVYLCEDDVSAEGLLKHRTTPLAGTQLDTLFYCTWSSPFGCFTHNTKVGSLFTADQEGFSKNQTQTFIDKGFDPLTIMSDFSKQNGIELFWSMRMNDTHDASGAWYGPLMLAASPLKQQHPEWLLATAKKRNRLGGWTAVDYGREEIRELVFRYFEEVCNNYDVDGIELDFLRHSVFFKSHAQGGAATEENLEQMTALIRRIRRMTEEVGLKRGRPILVAIRTHDSVDYCRAVGIDLERWLKDGLVDMLVATGYFRLNPWQQTIALGEKYGVAVYPCLSESRVRGEDRFRRNSVESYRGRASNALADGANGIYLYNYFNPNSTLWNELGDTQTLRYLDKKFFVTVRDRNPDSTLVGGSQYSTIPLLTPTHSQTISSSKPLATEVRIGDDIAAAARAGRTPKVTLHMRIPLLSQANQLVTTFNGTKLLDGQASNGWIDYDVPASIVKQGGNQVTASVQSLPQNADSWTIKYDGSEKPASIWRRDPGSERTIDTLVDGTLLIADRGTASGEYCYFRMPWGAEPASETVAEFRVKTISGSSFVIVSNGVSGERLTLAPDHISLFHNRKIRYEMDTTSDFHTYRLVLNGEDLQVYVDGTLRLDGKGQLKPRTGYRRNEVAFGASNSTDVGEAYWDDVKVRTASLSCHDIVVSVEY